MKHFTLYLMIQFLQFLFLSITVFCIDVNSKCNKTAELESGTIILAKPSIDAGGEFLDKILVRSLRDCYAACCRIPSCNIGVFKAKAPAYCFLFNCTPTSRCSFASQADYYVVTLTAAHSENVDRQQSRSSTNLGDHFQSPAAGLDEICSEQHPCTADHSFCSNGLCVCHKGWVRNGVSCVSVTSECPSSELQFRCNDSVTCVAIYDRCNGVIECPDGSDESNCPSVLASRDQNSLKRNHSQLESPSGPHTKWNSLSFLLNASSREGDQDQAEASASHRMVDSDDLLSVPFMPSSRYQLRSDNLHREHPLAFRRRSGLTRRESYPNRHPIVTSAATSPDWYLSDSEWEAPGYDQFSEYDSRYLTPSHTSGSRRLPLYDRDSHSRYDHEIFHGKSHKSWPTSDYFGPSVSSHSDNYEGLPTDSAYHPPYSRLLMREELVDPSVFPDSTSVGWTQTDRSLRTGHYPPGRAKPLSEKIRGGASSRENEDHPEENPGISSTASPAANSIDRPDAVSVLQRNQSESHTAALILAFSLGLLCCFVALLVFEWRRRRRAPGLSIRRRTNNVAVLFGDRHKVPIPGGFPGVGRNHKRTKSFRDPGGYVAVETDPDEDDKAAKDSLVL